MVKYGVLHTEVLNIVCYVIEAINGLAEFHISYSCDVKEQQSIAAGVQMASSIGFTNCDYCIDGILIWMRKPTVTESERAGNDGKKFFCSYKFKFDLNCQAVVDVHGRILDSSTFV